MPKFTELGLSGPILKAIDQVGYTEPTPIQTSAIPALLVGRDVLGIAQTGTGKTAAFVLPLLNAVGAHKQRPAPRTCRALILAPTRELVAQISENVSLYGKHVRHSASMVIGGVKPGQQVRALNRGVDILIATPGRLLDHMSNGAVRLDAVETVVLDEADQMLDMGFVPAIRKIMAALPAARQTLLFSATMPKPVKALAVDFLTDPLEIAVAPQSKPIDRIAQTLVYAEKAEKPDLAIAYLKTAGIERAIVFTRTKYGADKLCRQIEKAGMAAAAIHGNKSQNQRKRALADFKAYKIAVLVATDIAARGIDIDGVSHVVNYDLPNVPEAYVHRIGRTARAGKAGTAIAFCAEDERLLLCDIERVTGLTLPKQLADGTETDALPVTITTRPGSGRGARQPARSGGNKTRKTARSKSNRQNQSRSDLKPRRRKYQEKGAGKRPTGGEKREGQRHKIPVE